MRYPVSQPSLGPNAKKYVNECLDDNWVSSTGKYLELFENSLGSYLNNENTLVTSNGTTALHLALLSLNLRPGDEVLLPALTYIATANAVRYCGGVPICVDTNLETWNSDPGSFEEKITERTVGIIAVHLYGSPCDVSSLKELCSKKNLWLVEDCAEAIGATLDGMRVGNFGEIGTFSFYGNKIITTGEGGALTCLNSELRDTAKLYRGQGMDLSRRYWHTVVGYNYRMTNIQAAIGLSQVEELDFHINARETILNLYKHNLTQLSERGIISFQKHLPNARSVNWLTSITVDSKEFDRNELMDELAKLGIETRPFFHPVNSMPMYESDENPNALTLSRVGMNLPTYSTLDEQDVSLISTHIKNVLLGMRSA
jgi:perosamine synthetase